MLACVMLFACAKEGSRTAKALETPVRGESASPNIPEERIYFPFDSDYILPEAEVALGANIEWMKKESGAYIILEGHCDDVGPSEFNVLLGDRRARAVKAHMMEKGISAERIIMVVSYGSRRPLNPGHEIADLRQNRRVEFVLR